jgi:hypothetical protein
MKGKTIIILLVAALTFGVVLYVFKANPTIDFGNEEKVVFVTLPSPPKSKTISNRDDIERLESLLNQLPKRYQISLSNPKGWEMRIISKAGEITILEGYLIINGDVYRVDSGIETLRTFYRSLDIVEVDYP